VPKSRRSSAIDGAVVAITIEPGAFEVRTSDDGMAVGRWSPLEHPTSASKETTTVDNRPNLNISLRNVLVIGRMFSRPGTAHNAWQRPRSIVALDDDICIHACHTFPVSVPGRSPHVSRPGQLLRLTSLRAAAALVVFFYHLDIRGGSVGAARSVFKFGYVGVGFFFILSGFVLAWSFRPGESVSNFYVRRFARIYPSHFATLAIAVFVPVTILAVTAQRVTTDGLLIQTWFPPFTSPYALNGVSWSLSCEFAFYLALPWVLPRLAHVSSRGRWLIAGGYWIAASSVVIASSEVVRLRSIGGVWPPIRFGEFLLGVVAALEIKRGWRLSGRLAAVLAALGAMVFLLGPRDSAPSVAATLIFLPAIVFGAQRDLDRPNGLLTHRWLVYAGELSFAFYLVHELVMLNLTHALNVHGARADPILIVATCAGALALHHLIERPCELFIRRIGTRSSLPAGVHVKAPG
jgi:peptidoglycan/LPS O-acetylase OafA/YrhL